MVKYVFSPLTFGENWN